MVLLSLAGSSRRDLRDLLILSMFSARLLTVWRPSKASTPSTSLVIIRALAESYGTSIYSRCYRFTGNQTYRQELSMLSMQSICLIISPIVSRASITMGESNENIKSIKGSYSSGKAFRKELHALLILSMV